MLNELNPLVGTHTCHERSLKLSLKVTQKYGEMEIVILDLHIFQTKLLRVGDNYE